MPVKLYLEVTAAITATIGVTLITIPAFINTFFIPHSSHSSDIFIRFLGSALIGYAYLNWSTAYYDNIRSMRATLIGNFSTLFTALVISIFGVLDHALKTTGLFIVLLHFTFAAGFAIYLYKAFRVKPIAPEKNTK